MPIVPKAAADGGHRCVEVTGRAARNDALFATSVGAPVDPIQPNFAAARRAQEAAPGETIKL